MSGKTESDTISLDKLREMGFAVRVPVRCPHQELHKVRPGRSHKVYRPERYVSIFKLPVMTGRTPKPIREIGAGVDNRTVDELERQAISALAQLLRRAFCGDERATLRYVNILRRGVGDLDLLAAQQEQKLRAEAEMQRQWPVLLSLNPQDIDRAKELLHRLHVGEKADTRTGKRLDPRNFWTMLAKEALDVSDVNRVLLPELKRNMRGARRKREKQKLWHTEVVTTTYLSHADVLPVTGWQEQCASLSPPPITAASFKDWWTAIKGCVLQYWWNSPEDYKEALKRIQIGQKTETAEWQRRQFALDRIKQAFRSLCHLK